jgi:hypothetical protein
MKIKRLSIAIAAIVFFATPALAQTPTVVTGTVTDVNGVPYSFAKVSAQLIPTTASPTIIVNGIPTQIGGQQNANADTNGTFSMNLFCNTTGGGCSVISPSGTQWQITVNINGVPPPVGKGPQACSATLTISGLSQSVTSSFGACPALLNGGGNGYNPKDYGAIGDAKSSRNCTTTNAGSTITSTDNPWIVGDVAKKLQAVGNSQSSFGAAGGGNQNNEVTISAFNSAGSISVSPSVANQSAAGQCVWYTQQDHTAIFSAYNAADVGAQKGFEPAYNSPTVVRPGRVFLPKGGYVVCGTIYNDINHANNSIEGVSFIGEPGTDIYVAPCFVPPNGSFNVGTLFLVYLNNRAEFAHFTLHGMSFKNTNLSTNQYLFGTLSSGRTWVHDVNITEWGSSISNTAAFAMASTAGMNRVENLLVQGSSSGDVSIGCYFDTVALDLVSSFCSNHYINFKVNGSGQRTTSGPHFVLHGYQNDECGTNGLACFQIVNSTVNCLGCELLNPGGGVASASLDTTSSLYLNDSSLYTYFTDSGNSSSVVLAGNAQVYATGSNFSGNNTSAAIAGPSTATFADLGGNKWFNQVTGVLTACTAANYATCAFSGGVVPKATVTHTPNTCYAVTGNLLATAQNICTFLNDQNYQVLNITAQSGGTTPTNSSCTVAPVITLSDGTRTATLTMTTGKTQWSSAVDASTVNSVFASGTTLTISIAANTCGTPPSNVAVSYVLQSVLNP